MNEHLTEGRLNALADGTLVAAERVEAEQHVATCAACRAEVEGLRSLRRAAAALPRRIDPPRDLWPGIQPRLTIRLTGKPSTKSFRARLWLLAAAAVIVLGIGVALWWRPTAGEWEMAGGGTLRKGEWLETDDSSRVRLLVGRLGAVLVEAGSRVRLIEARRGEHRLELARGTIQARIIAKPRVFIVETPSATAVDLGCAYALTVDSLGNGLLHVTSGWVEFTWGNRSTVVPRDAYAATRPGAGPGTAYAADAPAALRRALAAFDFAAGGDAAVRTVLAAARPADAVTLLNLFPRVEGALRGAVFDRLALLSPPPSGVTRDGVLDLDETMLNRWWDRVAPPRLEKFDPENFGPPTVQLEPRP
jgi:hypothetical protein